MEEILHGISKLNTPELLRFHQKVGGLLSRRDAKAIPEREQALVEKLTGEFLPSQDGQRFESLLEKRAKGALPEEDKPEFDRLLQLVQNQSLQRLAWLVELCHLKGEPISKTMKRLGIKAVNPYNV